MVHAGLESGFSGIDLPVDCGMLAAIGKLPGQG